VLGVKARVWLAVDGAYAVRPFLLPVLALGIVVVSRLRKTPASMICQDQPILTDVGDTPSMANRRSAWRSVLPIGRAGKRSPTSAVAPRWDRDRKGSR